MYFVRHAQSVYNFESERLGYDPGVRDAPLTELGLRQARLAGEQLVGKGVRRLIASPYTRALQTAKLIAEAIDASILVEPLIGERCLLSCDIGTPRDALEKSWPQLDFSALAGEEWWPGFGESELALEKRITLFCAKWADVLANGDCAVVSHWHVLESMLGRDMKNAEIFFRPFVSVSGKHKSSL